MNNWGFEGYAEVPRIGLSGGLALGWHQELQVQVLIKSPNIIPTEVLDPKDDNFPLTFHYGHPTLEYIHQIWDQLQGIGTNISHSWLCIGDFNQVTGEEDKLTFKPSSILGNLPLIQALSNLSLLPVEVKGLSYTWMNKWKGNDFVMEKLDRAFANIDWFESYPDCLVTNLPIISSDHGPIILDTDPSTPFKRRPFRFEWMWTTHPDYPVIIKNAWLTNPTRGSHAYCLTKKLENVRDKFKAWNKTSFGLVEQQILSKKEQLRCAQQNIQTLSDVLNENRIRDQLEELMSCEEIMLSQKAKKDWDLKGDLNTKFFQAIVRNRQRRNIISQIRNSDNV